MQPRPSHSRLHSFEGKARSEDIVLAASAPPSLRLTRWRQPGPASHPVLAVRHGHTYLSLTRGPCCMFFEVRSVRILHLCLQMSSLRPSVYTILNSERSSRVVILQSCDLRNVSFPAKSAAVTQAPKIGKKVQKSKRPRAL